MRYGRGNWHWYDLIILGLAAAMVYPDEVLNWISERTGRPLGWSYLLLVEIASIALLISAMAMVAPAPDSRHVGLHANRHAVSHEFVWVR